MKCDEACPSKKMWALLLLCGQVMVSLGLKYNLAENPSSLLPQLAVAHLYSIGIPLEI